MFVDMTDNFKGFAQDPTNVNKVGFAYTNAPGANADYAIYVNSTMSSSGATRLTQTSFKNIGSIQFTPDGTKIVFTGAKPNPNDPLELIYKLYVISSSTANQVITAKDDADDAFVAPTGSKIVYTNWPVGTSSPKIKSCNIDGTGGTILTSTGDNFLPQYNKTGDKISFCSSRSGQYEIWAMDSTGANPVKLSNVNGSTSERCFGSSWSPDGTQVVFTRITLSATTSGIYKVSSAGGGSASQIRQNGTQSFIYWTPVSTNGPTRGLSLVPCGLGTSDRIMERMGLRH